MEWSNEKVLKLIAEYKARTLLWDPQDQNYRNKIKKNMAWEEIADIFELPRLEVERKFKILLVQYRREKAKIFKMVEAGYDLTHLEANAWYGYKSFEFFNNKYSSNSNMDVSDIEQTDYYNDEELAEIKIEPVSEDNNGEYNVENFLESTLQEIPQNKKRKISKPTDLTLKCKHNVELADDINVFASYIALEMRNLSNQKVRRKLKRNILRALLEACEEDDRIQLKIFSLQLLHRSPNFNACDMFSLDYTLLYTLIAAFTTYMVILIQFDLAKVIEPYCTTNTTIIDL